MPTSIESTSAGKGGVAKLAAKMAHELNNPLDAVLRYVSLAQRKVKTGDYASIERHLADAQFGLERMAEILRELMDIGREINDVLASPQLLPLGDLISHALRTTAAQAESKRVRVHIDNAVPQGIVPRYDLRLSQVLGNLLKNAIDAAPENSTVRLAWGLEGKSTLVMSVEDSGPGIDTELVPQLFTPFVTTKPKGAGHGLGLAISRELVLSLSGTISVENREPQGCVARIALPIS